MTRALDPCVRADAPRRIYATEAAKITCDTLRTIQAKAAAMDAAIAALRVKIGLRAEPRPRPKRKAAPTNRQVDPVEPGPTDLCSPVWGRVYVLKTRGFVKIGWSRNVEARIRDLQSGAPQKLELITNFEGDMRLELELHARFAKQRSHGEWFHHRGAVARWLRMGCPL